MYSNNFHLLYDSVNDVYLKTLRIFLESGNSCKSKSNTALFDTYDVRDGETPEMITLSYDDATLTILLFNEIHDRYHRGYVNNSV